MGSIKFDATTVDPDKAPEPVPAGWYPCAIVEAETAVSESKPEAGEMLKIAFRVQDGHPFEGKQLRTNLCYQHAKTTPREIAQRQLSAICHAIGVLQLEDTEQLLGMELRVKVKVSPASGEYGPKNDVIGYEKLTADEPDAEADAAEAEADAEAAVEEEKPKPKPKAAATKPAPGKRKASWK